MAQAKPKNLVYLNRDRGYRFADRDPDMDEICDLIDKSGLDAYEISELTAKASGGSYKVTPQTINNWLSGRTRRPYNFTMKWVAFALGYERKFTPIRGRK